MKYRIWNKLRKRNFLGKDSSGRKLYPFDYVEVQHFGETNTSYYSPIYWNSLDGAFVDAHPAHKKMGISSYRNLSDYFKEGTTCKKISYEKFLEKTK